MRYEDINPGRYRGTVTGSALGTTSTGKPQIAVGFDVHLTDEDGRALSLPMTWYGYFTEKTYELTDKALMALGFDVSTQDLETLNPDEPSDTPIYGAEASLVLEPDDKDRIIIRWVNKPGGGLALKDRMDRGEAASLAKQMRAKMLAARGPGGASAPASQPRRPAPSQVGRSNFDDIPF